MYALILFLIGLNQISETILLDIVYTNSQRDTRLVSEQWCLEQGIAIEDCIYDRFTCWAPGGVSRYPVEWHKMGVSRYITQEEDGSILVERLGRSYAIDVDYNYRYAENELAALDLPVVAVFESDWRTDGGSLYDCYHAFSPKIFEPYSIGDSIKKSVDILQGNMNIGRSIYIYDIRAFPAREIFLADDFEEVVTDEGQSVLRADIISILKGNYSIKVLGSPDLEGTISFEDQQGNVISKALLKNQQATIQLAESYTYIVCEVALNNVNDFEKVIISTIN